MNKFWWIVGITAFVAGCASFGPQAMVKAGNYSAAYSLVINDFQLTKDRKNVVASILQATGGAKGEVYMQTVQSGIRRENYRTRVFFMQTLRHINAAPSDGLLSQDQAQALRTELRDALEKSIMDDPQLLESEELLSAFGLARDRLAIAQRTLTRLVASGSDELEKFLPIYTVFKNDNDALRTEEAKVAMRALIFKNLTVLKNQRVGYSSLSIYVEYVRATGDHALDVHIKETLTRATLTRGDVENITKVFPEFSEKYLSTRQIKLDLKTNGDEYLVGEIADALKSVNEWVEVDPEAPRKINLVRLRLNEQRTQPINNTEVVSDPDFGTVLMMPKNASVMIDYSSSEYSLQWNFTVQDPQTKKSKPISGTQRLKKIECRNIRYQNVFGGVGALHHFPNVRVQRLCEDGASVDFDKARADVIRQIAQEINDNFIISN